jgi:hypothetical protein
LNHLARDTFFRGKITYKNLQEIKWLAFILFI